MICLAFNTTGTGTQFALEKNGKTFFLETEFSKHSETFFPLLDDFLNKHNTKLEDVDVFGVVNGPGSFTGIRIGLSIIKMFSYVFKKPCVVVDALEVLAYNIFDQKVEAKKICSVINAGSGFVYYKLFENLGDRLDNITEPKLCSVLQFEKICQKFEDTKILYYSNGETKNEVSFLEKFSSVPTSSSLAQSVKIKAESKQMLSYEKVLPIYIRFSQAENVKINDSLTIQKASIYDLNSILELEKQTDQDDLAWNEKSLADSFENDNFNAYILKDEKEVFGYISFMDLLDEYEILRIVVGKKARMKGVGQKLLKFLIELAKQNQKKSIVLEVNQFNYSALLLYQKMGFDIVGKRTKYYHKGQDGFIMRKFIDLE